VRRQRPRSRKYGLQTMATPFIWESEGTLRASPFTSHNLQAVRLDKSLMGAGLAEKRKREILETATHGIRCFYRKDGLPNTIFLLFDTRLDLRSLGQKTEQDYYCKRIAQDLKAFLEERDSPKDVLHYRGGDHLTDYGLAINDLVEGYCQRYQERFASLLG
jgi:hypothetical protein